MKNQRKLDISKEEYFKSEIHTASVKGMYIFIVLTQKITQKL